MHRPKALAFDGTHIPACVPFHMQDRFRGRKSITTQNVLAAVDFDLRFIYVLAGCESSAHDSYVLQDALSRPNGLNIPEGRKPALCPNNFNPNFTYILC
jgi:hypothetical protein